MAKAKTKSSTKSAASVLGSIGSTKTSKTKSTTPIIKITDEDQVKKLEAIHTTKTKEKEAKSAVAIAQGEFAAAARRLFEQRCHADATLHTSVKLAGGGTSLTYTQPRRCKKMLEGETLDDMKRIFGDDFDANFEIKKPLEIACDKLTEEQIVDVVEAIRKALPADVVEEVLDYTPQIVPKDGYHSRRILDAEIAKLAQQAESEGVAVPFSASFKI